jgi:tetratricopeptide (TPR) repeat protein
MHPQILGLIAALMLALAVDEVFVLIPPLGNSIKGSCFCGNNYSDLSFAKILWIGLPLSERRKIRDSLRQIHHYLAEAEPLFEQFKAASTAYERGEVERSAAMSEEIAAKLKRLEKRYPLVNDCTNIVFSLLSDCCYRAGRYDNAVLNYYRGLRVSLDHVYSLNELSHLASDGEDIRNLILKAIDRADPYNFYRVEEPLHNLAIIYDLKSDFDTAEKLHNLWLECMRTDIPSTDLMRTRPSSLPGNDEIYDRLLHDVETKYGTTHPYVATRLEALGHLYLRTNRCLDAQNYFRRAFVIRKDTSGTELQMQRLERRLNECLDRAPTGKS